MRRWLAVLSAAAMLCVLFPPLSSAEQAGTIEPETQVSREAESFGFTEYFSQYADAARIQPRQELPAQSATDATVQTTQGIQALLLDKGAQVSWNFEASAAGLYKVALRYMAAEQNGKALSVSLQINGRTPFSEAASIALHRVYEDDGPVQKDNRGNDIAPLQKETRIFTTANLDGSAN